jgi:hypothetical protein
MRNSFRGFGKTARAAKGQARPALGDRRQRVAEPDGAASTRRVMELKLVQTW